jgi:HK97 family phage prohead protease
VTEILEPDASREVRYAVSPLTGIDVRDPSANDDNTWTMSGYAAVFDQATTLFDGKYLKLTESIDPAAFDSVLRSQPLTEPGGVVHLNFGHDMNRAVAATDVPAGDIGHLELSADSTGLRFRAKVSRDDPDAVAMASKMRTGVVRQASFAFTVAKDTVTITSEGEDGPETEHRSIEEIGTLFDVCATPQGAYSQTVAQLRGYAASIGQPASVGGHQRQPEDEEDSGGVSGVSPIVGGVAGNRRTREMDFRVRAARRRFSKRME